MTFSTLPALTPGIERALQIGGGVLWTLTYILIIRQGFLDRTFGMPMVALCTNISWEAIFSFIHPHPGIQRYVNITWFLFDLVILVQLFHFGRQASDSPRFFYPTVLMTLTFSFCIVLFVTYEFNDFFGRYAAFGQNFMMSVLFVHMLVSRGNTSGQSIYIALSKMLGSLLMSVIFFWRYPSSLLLNFLYVATFIFDVIYAAMLYGSFRTVGINPWKP